ncbi:MAG: hypothetical protein WD851_07230 [Pirellulales bacterium]
MNDGVQNISVQCYLSTPRSSFMKNIPAGLNKKERSDWWRKMVDVQDQLTQFVQDRLSIPVYLTYDKAEFEKGWKAARP